MVVVGAVLTYILTPLFLFQAIYKCQFLEEGGFFFFLALSEEIKQRQNGK